MTPAARVTTQDPARLHGALQIGDLVVAVASATVNAQEALDESARRDFRRREDQGLPPDAWQWSSLEVGVGVATRFSAKGSLRTTTRVMVRPCEQRGAGTVTVRFRYAP